MNYLLHITEVCNCQTVNENKVLYVMNIINMTPSLLQT